MRTLSVLCCQFTSLIVGVYLIAVTASGAEPGSDRGSVQEIKNSVGMKLLFIPPGKFLMGSPESEPGREAQEVQHEVELTKGFYLGTHEVTFGQFKQFVADTNYQTEGERDGKGAYGANEAGKIEEMHARFTWKTPGFEQTDEHPVVDVSWQDAKAFCNWLSEKEKKTYRLATEAEWEYACRAGTKTAYVHGDDPEGLATVGNGADATARAKFPGWSIGIQGKDGHLFTAPVGQFKANAFSLYDMHGNVWEWCEDWYVPNSHPQEKQIDPTGPATGKAKVQRGGGWSSDSKRLRSAARVGRDQSAYRGCYLGFRVVLEQSPAEAPKESGTAAEKPAGGRVAYMLLVNGAVTDAVVKAANIEGHRSVVAPYIGTWHDIKGMERIQSGRLDRLERGEIDTLLIGTLHCYPHAETWNNHVGLDSTPAGLAALGVKNNPTFHIVWQTYVWPVGQMPKDGKKTLDVAAMKKRAASEPLKELEKLVDAINEKHGRKVVLISPVGVATIKLVEMVAEGKFPGITDPADLWTEFNMHSNRHVLALTAYCNVATMYGVSPIGLKPDFSQVTYGGGGKGPGIQSMEGITEEQRVILQNIAWEAVSKYPHAGFATTK
ncbi:Serine/threonine-protein kinase pkn1 [Anatilimnocola aggregata]|uniref:Serine/threonine-protein kinase pkn1 n=1 Tax=Anatilimnocola aggregata TaxID=2528021 RepID=A0A517Y478_9BACT|nr:formylglycine-generating enzyme family protein [Anatilimnocola aggregata]QDU25034.1 Serine/threonine-protein kinase pkn1 [Anatilimnocola aggregata]